jgi:hypothetical protein
MFRALIMWELAAAVAVVGVCGQRRRVAAETRDLPKAALALCHTLKGARINRVTIPRACARNNEFLHVKVFGPAHREDRVPRAGYDQYMDEATILHRPVGKGELDLIRASGFARFSAPAGASADLLSGAN